MTRSIAAIAMFGACMLFSSNTRADDLFHDQTWANVASDRKASKVGDILTVVVYQNAESRNAGRNEARRRHSFDGAFNGGTIHETGQFSLDSAYSGQGEIRRSESLVTQISVVIENILPNGDYQIAGDQLMYVNGERTTIRVRGRVRPTDVSGDNQVLSTRIADAQINYDGRGFVSRNARPGIIQRIFGLLGFGA